jgi:endonuclease/exonuclease/phosphatase family metal-dependent hydrolase
MRLLSIDARTTGRDRAALAESIESAEVDVACLQHGPHLLRWRSISAALGRRSGLVVVTGGRTAGANLVLSTLGVDVLATAEVRAAGARPWRPAGAALAALQLRDLRFVLVSASLTGPVTTRAAQAQQIVEAIRGLLPEQLPSVIAAAGVAPDTAAWRLLSAGREAVAGRVFVDPRLGVGETHEDSGGAFPPLVVSLGG